MANSKQTREDNSNASKIKMGLSAGSFITAALIVVVISMYINIDWPVLLVIFAVLLGLAIGVPAVVYSRKATDELEDEDDTCKPIVERYRKSRSTSKLIADYEEWTAGEHSSYTRIHFGAEVIDLLRDAKEYEAALKILNELGSVKMGPRERYDFDNYYNSCEPQLRDGIATEEKRAAERARNKNLRKK